MPLNQIQRLAQMTFDIANAFIHFHSSPPIYPDLRWVWRNHANIWCMFCCCNQGLVDHDGSPISKRWWDGRGSVENMMLGLYCIHTHLIPLYPIYRRTIVSCILLLITACRICFSKVIFITTHHSRSKLFERLSQSGFEHLRLLQNAGNVCRSS